MTVLYVSNSFDREYHQGVPRKLLAQAGSYLRLLVFVYHSTLDLRVIKKRKQNPRCRERKGHALCFADHVATSASGFRIRRSELRTFHFFRISSFVSHSRL